MTCLQNGLRPNQSGRREVVKNLVDDIHTISQKPGKRPLAKVAQEIMKTSKIFNTGEKGALIRTGYGSLLKQLQSSFDNIKINFDSHSFERKCRTLLSWRRKVMWELVQPLQYTCMVSMDAFIIFLIITRMINQKLHKKVSMDN